MEAGRLTILGYSPSRNLQITSFKNQSRSHTLHAVLFDIPSTHYSTQLSPTITSCLRLTELSYSRTPQLLMAMQQFFLQLNLAILGGRGNGLLVFLLSILSPQRRFSQLLISKTTRRQLASQPSHLLVKQMRFFWLSELAKT
jgi:hypothetical protein